MGRRLFAPRPNKVRERHPLTTVQNPALPVERQVTLLANLVSLLWDEVWWTQLPFWRRWWYMAQGFRSPIAHFYEEIDGD